MPILLACLVKCGRRPVFGILALFLFLVAVPQVPGATELRYGQGLLWQLERGDAAPSYLFGTVHISDPRVLDLPAEVRGAFDGAARAVFEIVLTPEAQTGIGQAMILQDGRSLDGILGPELFATLVAAAAPYGLPQPALRLFKPWSLIAIFSYPPREFARIVGGAAPLDEWLQSEAELQGTPVFGLETPEQQIALFEGIPEDQQIEMVRSLVRDAPQADQRFSETVRLYLARDLSGIRTLLVDDAIGEDAEVAADFERRFIVERNRRMAEGLSEHLDAGGAFVAVGALHLPGEEGILRLLEAQGYKVSLLY